LEVEEEMHGKQDSIHHQISFKGESQLAVITRKCKKGASDRMLSFLVSIVTCDFHRKIETFKRY
jgi:hypothetical protein